MKSIRYIQTKFLNKVAKFEGFRSCPYQDAGGTWTIGFGHTKSVTKYTRPISYDDALVLLANDLENIRIALSSEPYSLNSSQWDSIVDFCFNLGITAYKKSTLRKRIIEYSNLLDNCKYAEAIKMLDEVRYEFQRWRFVTLPNGTKKELDGLFKRRYEEFQLFVSDTIYYEQSSFVSVGS